MHRIFVLFQLLGRLLNMWRARWQLRGCVIGRGVECTGSLQVANAGRIEIGSKSKLLHGLVPTQLVAHPNASLHIGNGCLFNYGSHLEAHQAIYIGNNCMLASNVRICDSHESCRKPITIDDDVWLAHGVTVHPGVHIGRGAVVSAGSIVTADIPPHTLAVGNPARALPLGLVSRTTEKQL